MLVNLNPLRKSLSTRLLLVFISASVILTLVVVATLMYGFASAWRANARPHLELYLDYISEDIGNPPSESSALALSKRLPVNIYIQGSESYFSTTGKQIDVEGLRFGGGGRRPHMPSKPDGFSDVEFSGDEDRTLLKRQVGDFQVYYELSHQDRKNTHRRFMIPALLLLLATLTGLYFIIRRMLLPVKDIRQGVIKMGQGDLAHRITIRRNNDLGVLAGSINTMASDIESMLESKRALLLGASHELRSPLTRAKVATQLLPESPQRELIEDDLQEMESLIADILESERMKSGHSILDRELVDLEQLIHSVLSDMRINGVEVEVEVSENLPPVSVDIARFSILLRNLVGNSVAHNNDDNGVVRIAVAQENDIVTIRVSDNGPGISAAHLDKVTEPFYRTDESRTRKTGGFGLGLHLAKLIADAHGGSLDIRSRTALNKDKGMEGENFKLGRTGTDVTISLPLVT